MENIEIVEDKKLLVYKKGYTAAFVNKTMREMNLVGLTIFDHLDRIDSLEFLNDCPNIKKLSIYCIGDHDYSFLQRLPLLEDLRIGKSVEQKNIIDLSNLVHLEKLIIDWRKGKIKGLANCKNLKELCIWSFKEDDFTVVKELTTLRVLDIRTSSVKTSEGLQHLHSLEQLLLGYCRSLRSIKDINGLQKLKSIIIESCSKIEDYEYLTKLDNLENLELINVKGIKSIKFIENFRSLQKLFLVASTEVLDGDLTPATFIKRVVYSPRKHYNIKPADPGILSFGK